LETNAEKLEALESDSYDLYTIAFGIRNVTNRDAALREAYRILRKGGRFMCLEFSEVETPIFKQIYDFYSFNVIPL
jgi:ubiquinone/menaquinone biosynthesis C-methylase UbiE